MTVDNSPIVTGVLYVAEGLLLTGIAAIVTVFFRLNGDIRDIKGDVREVKGLLNHPDNGVTARAKATDKKVDDLTERLGRQETKQETEHVALERRVVNVEQWIEKRG